MSAVLAGTLGAGCATLADGAPGLDNPPSARAGPFRLLKSGELGQSRAAPFAMDLQKTALRDPSVVDVDGDPSTLAVEAYFAASDEDAGASAPPTSIVRVSALDGRSFDRSPVTVLASTQAWEGGTVGAPSVLADDARRRLYYAAEGGIGLAESEDGDTFTARDAPVLADVPWADGVPRSPAVVTLPNGHYRMFFEATRGGVVEIGEASSTDGVAWDVSPEPAIARGGEGALDSDGVASPDAVVATSEEGRDILYVYYSGTDADGKRSIALAARFLAEPDAPLEKGGKSVYSPSGSLEPHEPSVVRFEDFTFLFSTQKRTKDSGDVVVTVGVSPGDVELPSPNPP
jgi:hypothetical protein